MYQKLQDNTILAIGDNRCYGRESRCLNRNENKGHHHLRHKGTAYFLPDFLIIPVVRASFPTAFTFSFSSFFSSYLLGLLLGLFRELLATTPAPYHAIGSNELTVFESK